MSQKHGGGANECVRAYFHFHFARPHLCPLLIESSLGGAGGPGYDKLAGGNNAAVVADCTDADCVRVRTTTKDPTF